VQPLETTEPSSLLIATPLAHFIVPDENMSLKYIAAFALLCGNWACVLWGYPHSVAAPLWSVSIEEQFYLTWPFVMRRWIRHLPIVALVLLAISFTSRLWLVARGAIHPQIWCNTLARLDPIACGALLAIRVQGKDIVFSLWLRVTLILLACALLTAAGRYGDFVGIKALITFPIVTAACIILILGSLGLQSGAPGDGPIVRGLVYFGRISYGMYVFHWMFVEILGVPSAHASIDRSVRGIALLIATTATAALSYQFFEKPFLRWKEKYARIQSRPA
jgi:peptidoglycan/LPS O-acetylase OafA/YrhL